MLLLSNVFLSLNGLASCVHSLPFHIDVLSCSKGVEAAQDVVAGNLHVTHWKERKERHCLAPSQLATSRTRRGSPNRKTRWHPPRAREVFSFLSLLLPPSSPIASFYPGSSCWTGRGNIDRRLSSPEPSQFLCGAQVGDHKESLDHRVLPDGIFFFLWVGGDTVVKF